MADKNITYKVNVDDSDLAQRLAQIKQEIDFALSGQPIGGNQLGIERAVPMTYGTYGGLSPLPSFNQYLSPTQAGLGIADSSLTNAYQNANMSLQTSQTSLYNAYQRIGATRDSVQSTFHNTMNRIGTNFRDTVTNVAPSEANFGILGNDNWVGNLLGMGGVGYNPDMAVSLGLYRDMQQHRLAYNMPGMAGGVAGFGLGFLGMGAGPLGLAVGLGAGIIGEHTVGAGLRMMFGAELQDMQTADYVNFSIAQRGTLLSNKAGQGLFEGVGGAVASRMREYTRSPEGFIAGVSRTEAEQALKMFTDMGGFDTARTADEYTRRFDDMLEGHKKIMHAFRISQQKAIQFMTEMQNAGLTGTAESAAQLQGAAQSVGLAGTTLVDFGLQSQRAAWQAIPGLSAAGGFTMGIATLMTTQQLAREGLLSNEFLARMGGGEEGIRNIATTMQGLGFSLANTPTGRMQLQVGRGGFGMDSFSLVGAGIGSLNGLTDMVKFATGVNQGQQMEAIGGPMNMILSDVERTIQQMRAVGMPADGANGSYSEEAVKAMLIKKGYTINQAESALQLSKTPIQSGSEVMRNALANEAQTWLNERPTELQQMQANFSSAITRFGEGAAIIGGGAFAGMTIGAGFGAAVGAAFGGIGALPGAAAGALLGGIVGGSIGVAGVIAGPEVRNRILYKTQRMTNDLVGTPTSTDSKVLSHLLTGTDSELTEYGRDLRNEIRFGLIAKNLSNRSATGYVDADEKAVDKEIEKVLRRNEQEVYDQLSSLARSDKNFSKILGNDLTSVSKQLLNRSLELPNVEDALPNLRLRERRVEYSAYNAARGIGLIDTNLLTFAGKLGLSGNSMSEIYDYLQSHKNDERLTDVYQQYGSLSQEDLYSALATGGMIYSDKSFDKSAILRAQAQRNELLKQLPNSQLLSILQTPGTIDFKNNPRALDTELTYMAGLNSDDANRIQAALLKRLIDGQVAIRVKIDPPVGTGK